MITQRLTLKIDEKTNPVPAFIMYLPVLIGGEVYGYVLSPFRMPTLLMDLLGRTADLIALDIYDGTELLPDTLFYRSDNGEDSGTPRLTELQTLDIGGREWTLEFSTRAGLEARADNDRPQAVLLIGLAFSLLLFIITWSHLAAPEPRRKPSPWKRPVPFPRAKTCYRELSKIHRH